MIREERMKRLEWEIEKKKREKRKSNSMVRGVKMGEGGEKEALRKMEKLMEDIGVVVKVERARVIGRKDREGRAVVWAKLGGVEDKKKIMREKRKLPGRKERVEDDLTWGKKKAAWRIGVEAEERRKGKIVKVRYMKMWVDGMK